jgi:hypothetical protein
VRSESRCALRLRYGTGSGLYRPSWTSLLNTFYKCTATSRTQICRKCLRIKLNEFRPVQTLVDIASNTFYKCTATFGTHCTTSRRSVTILFPTVAPGYSGKVSSASSDVTVSSSRKYTTTYIYTANFFSVV